VIVLGAIGAKALYLLFVWLASAAGAAWLSERKGYTERVGLTFGLVLTFVGFFIVLLLPARPGSAWKREGALPKRRRPGGDVPLGGDVPPGGDLPPGGDVSPGEDVPPSASA
jgi:hypothetical protein